MTNSSRPQLSQPDTARAQLGMLGLAETAPASNVPRFLRQYIAPLWMRVTKPSLNVRDRVFRNEIDFWKDVQRNLLATVRFESFWLSDWFPRTPGVAQSRQGQAVYREWVDSYVWFHRFRYKHLEWETRHSRVKKNLGQRVRREFSVRRAELAHRLIEEGGAGTIRLLPRRLDGEHYWFGTALAGEMLVDCGIPVAIPASRMERSAAQWGDLVNMTGKVGLLADAGLNFVGEQVHHAPPVLVFVEEMTVAERTRAPPRFIRPVVLLDINAPDGPPDDPKNLRFAFVSAHDNATSDVEEHLSTLAKNFRGRILTNFDQVTPALADAPLSYQKLLSKKYDESLLLRLGRDGGKLVQFVNCTHVEIERLEIEKFQVGRFSMPEYKNYGQAGAFGEHARADNATFVQQAPGGLIDAEQLANQLAAVRKAMKEQAKADDPSQDAEIGVVSQAQAAADAGETSKALDFLKAAGQWTLDVAKSVAAKLVEDALKGKLGP